MTPDDLQELDDLLSAAGAVVPMRDVHNGWTHSDVIGLRHDVDDNEGSFDTALRMAEWEHERGYRSTYFLLHTARYWRRKGFNADVRRLEKLGHEVGLHVNAIPVALKEGDGDPTVIAHRALLQLRRTGVTVIGVAPHGDPACYAEDRKLRFVNDEIFTECPRPEVGPPARWVENVLIEPVPLAAFGLEYETYRLPKKTYISDSGGAWNVRPSELDFPACGQLHILQHPDWWGDAL